MEITPINMTKLNIRQNITLKNKTTFKIGGPARHFITADKTDIVPVAQQWAKDKNMPYFILGGGSNVLMADAGFPGLVIAITDQQLIRNKTIVTAAAGVKLANLVKTTTAAGLSGLECCYGIPGTLGGAIYGNAGSKDNWIGESVQQVQVLNPEGEIKTIPHEKCQFDYRSSRFSDTKEIILSARLQLNKAKKKAIAAKLAKYKKVRKNQPRQPSAGSVFKNPSQQAAGYLIEQVGLKGYQIGGAGFSEKHANFIINRGNAQADDVIQLMKTAQQKVADQFNVKLKPEIKLIGFNKNPLLYD